MRLKRKHFVLVSVGIIAIIAALFAVWSQSSSQGTTVTSYQKTKDPAAAEKTLDGKNIRFQYANRYGVRNKPLSDRDLEVYELIADTVYDKRISLSVATFAGNDLSTDASYNLRRAHPEEYGEKIVTVGQVSAHVMVSQVHKEQTAFIIHNGKLATIAFVTDGANDILDDEVKALLSSITWKDKP